MSSTRIEGTAVRSTAATRLVFEDLKAPEQLNELTKLGSALENSLRELMETREVHAELTRMREIQIRNITLIEYDKYYDDTSLKHSSAELERRTKHAIMISDDILALDDKLHEAKIALDDAAGEYDSARFAHRTGTSQVGLTTQILNYLSSSKTARSAALGMLAEL